MRIEARRPDRQNTVRLVPTYDFSLGLTFERPDKNRQLENQKIKTQAARRPDSFAEKRLRFQIA
jgi:hypothetical protein